MTKLPIGIARVDSAEGATDYVTCLPQQRVFTHALPSEGILGVLVHPLKKGENITTQNFAANDVFIDFMQGIISRRGPWMADLIAAARAVGNGPLYVIDRRTKTPEGKVPSDVFG